MIKRLIFRHVCTTPFHVTSGQPNH
ncbi:unnamed protein product [Spirodela intermedia]|uniref:Uncharacterized protein n=1 Tax=Spirodela intermedia TaxID=51605 RepID=A0A7I8JSP9_SPIIN|nr:unnamed protein product [Spirodela intermedia]CAA6672785.1 unnamed protein product [Spirodela intermedia]